MHRLVREQFFARPRGEVFAFFADASNLERITPEFLRFEMLTPMPIELKPGALIDYRLRLFGIPIRWTTRIETFEPETSFSDVQLKGPYRSWHHLHEFFEHEDGTLMRDTVGYELPLGPLGALARRLFVSRNLDRIFEHRRAVLRAEFG